MGNSVNLVDHLAVHGEILREGLLAQAAAVRDWITALDYEKVARAGSLETKYKASRLATELHENSLLHTARANDCFVTLEEDLIPGFLEALRK